MKKFFTLALAMVMALAANITSLAYLGQVHTYNGNSDDVATACTTDSDACLADISGVVFELNWNDGSHYSVIQDKDVQYITSNNEYGCDYWRKNWCTELGEGYTIYCTFPIGGDPDENGDLHHQINIVDNYAMFDLNGNLLTSADPSSNEQMAQTHNTVLEKYFH